MTRYAILVALLAGALLGVVTHAQFPSGTRAKWLWGESIGGGRSALFVKIEGHCFVWFEVRQGATGVALTTHEIACPVP